jgi:hypothetical protein
MKRALEIRAERTLEEAKAATSISRRVTIHRIYQRLRL